MIIRNEYGKILILDTGFDLSSQNGLSLVIDRPDGSQVTRTQASGLAVGGTDLTVDGTTYSANTYVTYTVQDGDLQANGFYYYQLTVSFTGKRLSTERTRFEVAL